MSESFIYMVILTDGRAIRVVTDGDPTDHPAFFGRVESVITVGPVHARHLHTV